MARFDVYPHPEVAMRPTTPFLLDVQNNFIDRVASRVVIPMRDEVAFVAPAEGAADADLAQFDRGGREVHRC